MLENTKELNEKLKDCLRKKSDIFRDGNLGIDKVTYAPHFMFSCWCDKFLLLKAVKFTIIQVKLGSAGWKQRYYKEKFLVEDPKEVEIMRKQIVCFTPYYCNVVNVIALPYYVEQCNLACGCLQVHKYTEGLCWVLLYYFSGIPSWNW